MSSSHNDQDRGVVLACRDLSRCLLCEGPELRPAGFTYVFEQESFPGVRCARCGFCFLSRQPVGDSLAHLYAADYFDSDYHCGHEEQSYFRCDEGQTASADVLLDWFESARAPGRILEVGSAGGYFLQAARRRGWDPVGIEISESAAAFARDELGLDVHTGSLDSVPLDAASFDAAYLGDVLEHIPEPLQALRTLHDALRPGGVLMIAGPITINSLDRRVGLAMYTSLGRSKSLHQPPYHLSEFTPATLRFALRRAGLAVRWLRQQKIPPTPANPRRRSPIEHVAKLILDAINWPLTAMTGRLGDRAIVMAAKPAD